jgi:hypothetical protein
MRVSHPALKTGRRPLTSLKNLVLMATVLAGSLTTTEAKSATGIYLTAEAYKNGHLASESDCGSPGHRVELHDILHKPFIEVTHEGQTRRYEKSQIYGFRSCGGHDYRFVENDEYQILEAKELSIYAREVPVENRKDTGDLHVAASREYFFSVSAGGQVLPLTLQNLKRAFPNNHAFHDALDKTFNADDELAQFDAFHKMFKVNRLLVAPSVTK